MAGAQTIGDAIKEMGGVKCNFRTIMYAQSICRKHGANLDDVADYIKNNYPQFGIESDEDLQEILEGRDELIWKTPEEIAENAFRERFGWAYDEDLA